MITERFCFLRFQAHRNILNYITNYDDTVLLRTNRLESNKSDLHLDRSSQTRFRGKRVNSI